MKTLGKLAILGVFAFLIGFGSVAVRSQSALAEKLPQDPYPAACDCTRFFECGNPSPMCNGYPAMLARKFLHDCMVECGWEEVGCCSTPS